MLAECDGCGSLVDLEGDKHGVLRFRGPSNGDGSDAILLCLRCEGKAIDALVGGRVAGMLARVVLRRA